MKRSQSWFAVLPSLVIPVCIGMMLYLGLLSLINNGTIADETVLRYLMGHPVSKITVAMFLIGSASLLLIGKNVFEQFRAERRIVIEPEFSTADETLLDHDAQASISSHAVACGQSLMSLPPWMHEHYLWQRITNALQSVYRTSSAANVEEELKYLADLDLERQQQRYSLVQILIWATPMLGFLGTVLGISQALGGITVGPENDFQQMMDGLKGSLYVAFDTTALALSLSMILMFGQFLIDRFESQLLSVVDQRARSEIAKQFDLSAVREQQTLAAASHKKIEHELASTINQSVSELASRLGDSIEKADHSMSHRWEQWQVLLSDNARLMSSQQLQLCEQTEIISKILTQTKTPPGEIGLSSAWKPQEKLSATSNQKTNAAGSGKADSNPKIKPDSIKSTTTTTINQPQPTNFSEEVILPFPTKTTIHSQSKPAVQSSSKSTSKSTSKPTSKPTSHSDFDSTPNSSSAPEIILPFLKKAA